MTAPLPPLPRLFRRAAGFNSDRRGIAATEFALILPIMLVLFVGVTEVGQAISISRKVTITVRTVTDLVTQYSALSTSDMSNLLAASAQVMAPYPSSKVSVTVSEVSTDSNGNATITWSSALNGTPYATGAKVTLPSGLAQPNISLIWGQVQYNYAPVLGDNIIGPIALSDQIYMNPRLCTAIAYGSSVTTSTSYSDCASTSTTSSSTSSSSTSSSSTSSTSSTSSSSTSSTSSTSTSTSTSSTSTSTSSDSTSSSDSSGSSGSGSCSWWSWSGCSWW